MREKLKNSLFLQLISFSVIILVSLLLAFLITNSYFNSLIRKNTLNLNQKILHQIEGKLEDFHETMNNVSAATAYSPTTSAFLAQDSRGRVRAMDDMLSVFHNTMQIEKNILGILLCDVNRNVLARIGNVFLAEADWQYTGDTIYFSALKEPKKQASAYYYIYYPVYDLDSKQYRKQAGMCVLAMDTKNLAKMLEDTPATGRSQVFLIDGNNRILASAGETLGVVFEETMAASSREYDVQIQNTCIPGWRIVSRVNKNEMRDELMTGYVTIAYALSFVFISLILYFCYRNLVLRIRRVSSFIQRVVDQPELRMPKERLDEIGMVVRNLNQMLDEKERMNREIQETQAKAYEAELARKQLEVLAYRNQINPHFLYNTFECIRGMAMYYEVEEIAEITMALSNVFRYAVRSENIVTLQEEIDNMMEYGKIIEYRFMGKIEVDVDVKEELKGKKMIKLMLQPLVENAVFHGLERKKEGGEVNVTVRAEPGERLRFCIQDNGCGIKADQLDRLRQSLRTSASQKGIGMANIYQRLRLFYGTAAAFSIDSQVGIGTTITIVIPDHIEEGIKNNV